MYKRQARASRAYDVARDGFVIAGGAGVVVLEELEHAKARGAKIYGEIVGYGVTSDGYDMVAPSGEGAIRCMQPVSYTHLDVYKRQNLRHSGRFSQGGTTTPHALSAAERLC